MKSKIIKMSSFFLGFLIFSQGTFAESIPGCNGDVQQITVITTAYYSPFDEPIQNHWVTGSYDGDIALNGAGHTTANGSSPMMGTLAVPRSVPFGSTVYIPGFGWGISQDRGGAIIELTNEGEDQVAGQEIILRVDIWMGAGPEGLYRALNWGYRESTGYLCLNPDPHTSFASEYPKPFSSYLEFLASIESGGYDYPDPVIESNHLSTGSSNTTLFSKYLEFGSEGEEVKLLQNMLKELGFYNGNLSGYFDEGTYLAVGDFQLAYDVIPSKNDYGYGYVGPKTQASLKDALSELTVVVEPASEDEGEVDTGDLDEKNPVDVLIEKHEDLDIRFYEFEFIENFGIGSQGEAVTILQSFLSDIGYYQGEINGVFDENTEHAVGKFQESQGIVKYGDPGYGNVGPITRGILNQIFADAYSTLLDIAQNRDEIEDGSKEIIILEP